jgi:signal transduction histidine kinase
MSVSIVESTLARADRVDAGREDWLTGGGEMGKYLRAKDWSKTPLGPLAGWPQSLRTTVSLCLASNFPISLAWGPHHIQIYNDGYWPICGGKHPESMGQDFSECWSSAWPVIGESFARALRGETSYLENQRMFLDRNGYLEETFFTFSFSPIRDESGGIGGLFHPVTENTSQMLSERRTITLRDLSARTVNVESSEEALRRAAETLAGAELDVPFVLLYQVSPDGESAELSAQSGIEPGTELSRQHVDLTVDDPTCPWSLHEVMRGDRALERKDLRARFAERACGPYPEAPDRALVFPITPPTRDAPAALLIVGASARLPFDERYRVFFELTANCVTTALASAIAYEEERQRAEALAEIDRAKTAFFSNISHEFRTPLTLMLGPIEDELNEPDPLPPARRERLTVAHRNALRLLKLVNTLLDFSRIEAGRTDASFEPVDLAALTGELASMFRSAVERGGLIYTVDCQPLPEPIYVDRDMWEKIVLNLLSNAFKHTFHGSVAVGLSWTGNGVELVVRDSGVGISSAELPHLFERFHRVRGARSRTHEGTGIGLALVRELVLLHSGTVTVESREGEGSLFRVALRAGKAHLPSEFVNTPRTLLSTSTRASVHVEEALHWLPSDAAERPDSYHPPSPEPSSDVAPAGPRPRILWADDNVDMRDYVLRLLSERYEVQAVPDGLAALAAALTDPPDLVLSDVMMPGLDGFALLAALREDPRTHPIPVILLSARAGEEAALSGLDAGADDYLAKPFSARELLARVRTHIELAQARRKHAEELAAANKELEAFSYSVSHDLRAPLRAIDGFSSALLEDHGDSLNEEGRSYLQRVRAAAARMTALIDDLLNLARMTRGPLRRAHVDVSELARTILEELQRRNPEREVSVEIEPGLGVHADPRLVQVLLDNLLGNAWKFTGKKHDARIVVGRTEDLTPALFVRDNGAGFDSKYAGKLFQPFQRLHLASDFEGTGIGLATVQRIAGRHGGRVWVDAAVGLGATFFFNLGETR